MFCFVVMYQHCKCEYKGQNLLSIMGEFACNALLPNDFAFGHAVNHGYGWIEVDSR
jgi:hypothetical protein